jgi:hypothetical protein
MNETDLRELVRKHPLLRQFGLLGARVHAAELNVDLDAIASQTIVLNFSG